MVDGEGTKLWGEGEEEIGVGVGVGSGVMVDFVEGEVHEGGKDIFWSLCPD